MALAKTAAARPLSDWLDRQSARALVPRYQPWLWLVYGLSPLAMVSFAFTNPFHPLHVYTLLFVAEAPAVLALVAFMILDSEDWPFISAADYPHSLLRARLLTILLLFGVPAQLFLWSNQALDRSPVVHETVVITGTSVTSGRGGTRYRLEFVAAEPSPLADTGRARWLMGTWPETWRDLTRNADAITVTRDEYLRAIPGRTQLTLDTHKGLFGLPWFAKRTYSLAL